MEYVQLNSMSMGYITILIVCCGVRVELLLVLLFCHPTAASNQLVGFLLYFLI